MAREKMRNPARMLSCYWETWPKFHSLSMTWGKSRGQVPHIPPRQGSLWAP